MARKSFVMYESWAAMITALPDNQALQIMRAICAFQTGSNYVIDDPVVKAYFESTVLPEMEENARKYQAKVENANISAEKRIANTKSESQIQKANRSESKANRSESQANKSEGVYVYVNDNDNEYVDVGVNDDVNDSDTEKPKTEKKSAEKKPHCEDPDLERALNDFIDSRKANKKPMTERAITLLINRLEQLAPGDNKKKIELLNIAILHGWQSVYIPRDRDIPGKQSSGSGYIDAINHRMDSLKEWAADNGINTDDTEEGSMF